LERGYQKQLKFITSWRKSFVSYGTSLALTWREHSGLANAREIAAFAGSKTEAAMSFRAITKPKLLTDQPKRGQRCKRKVSWWNFEGVNWEGDSHAAFSGRCFSSDRQRAGLFASNP